MLARAIPWIPGIVYALTPTCERLDLVMERVSAVPTSGFGRRALVFDRDGLDGQVPAPPTPPGPDRAKVETAIEEPLRYLALLPALLDRGAFLLIQEGYGHIRRRLVELYLEANAPAAGGRPEARPLPAHRRAVRRAGGAAVAGGRPGGADRRPPGHRQPSPPDRPSRSPTQVGQPWPQPLEDAVRAHLRRELGIDLDD